MLDVQWWVLDGLGVRNLTILRYYGPEFVARALQEFFEEQHVDTLFIAPEAPWENGVAESFNSRLRDELLDRELFVSLAEVKVILEKYRKHYFEERLHSSLGYRKTKEYIEYLE